MGDKRWILGLIILVLAIGSLGWFGFQKNNQVDQQIAGQSTSSEKEEAVYFDDNAKVMYFYSDYCSWCLKEKEVLTKLGGEGYRVKPMDVGKNPEYWEQYKISGTPSFIAASGEILVGYKEYDELRAWLDANKN